MNILITGGAGFIGLNLCRALIKEDYNIRILDNFSNQIHGDNNELPDELKGKVELLCGDIRDKEVLIKSLKGIDTIVHLAAETGTGQSMYEIDNYYSVNIQGTAALLDVLQNSKDIKKVKNLIVASSRAIYGEGAYNCVEHGIIYPEQRIKSDLQAGIFDPVCPTCQKKICLVPTKENATLKPMSFYAITKQVQEQSILLFAKNHGLNAFALRYQNVYGPGQSLNNPYTGILAVFSNLAKEGKKIDVYEDGFESRDFVYIDDVVDATCKAIKYQGKFVGSINVGSGRSIDVLTIAQTINEYFGNLSIVEVNGSFRLGDIRHNIADLSLAKEILNFFPKTDFENGLKHFIGWAKINKSNGNRSYEDSIKELQSFGLMGSSK